MYIRHIPTTPPPSCSLSSASMCWSFMAEWWIDSITLSQLLSESMWHARLYFTRTQQWERARAHGPACGHWGSGSGQWGGRHCCRLSLHMPVYSRFCLDVSGLCNGAGSKVTVAVGRLQWSYKSCLMEEVLSQRQWRWCTLTNWYSADWSEKVLTWWLYLRFPFYNKNVLQKSCFPLNMIPFWIYIRAFYAQRFVRRARATSDRR